MNVSYDALIVGDRVHVFAAGVNPTSGWKNYFQKSLLTVYPPLISFVQIAPHGMVLQVLTPFSAETSFPLDADKPLKKIDITDEDGKHSVLIRSKASIAEAALLEKAVRGRVYLPGSQYLSAVKERVASKGKLTFYERTIASYDDWLSQDCTTECSKVEEIDHTGIKLCTEYRTVCKHIRNYAVLVVQVAEPQEIARAVELALEKAAAAAALAAVIAAFLSGGSAAAGAAKATFVSVLTSELAQSLSKLVRVDLDFRSEWV